MKAIKVFSDPKAFELAADKTRRRIIHLLRARELSVSQIADELEMTPQAIYHHVRKLLDGGLIEVAKEERIDHFIETYYRAAAEVFHFEYGEATGEPHQDARIREALQALAKVGLIFEIDDETVSKFSKLSKKIASACSKPEIHEKIAELEDLDFVTKQFAMEIAAYVCGSDKEFAEMLSLRKEARELLKSRLAEQPSS